MTGYAYCVDVTDGLIARMVKKPSREEVLEIRRGLRRWFVRCDFGDESTWRVHAFGWPAA